MAITLVLLLMRKVHLLPPSIKDLQIFRFLKNGKVVKHNIYFIFLLLFHFFLFLYYIIEFESLCCRRFVDAKGNSSDILCDLGSIIGSKARVNFYGCISNMPTSLVDIISSCRWFSCCCSGN